MHIFDENLNNVYFNHNKKNIKYQLINHKNKENNIEIQNKSDVNNKFRQNKTNELKEQVILIQNLIIDKSFRNQGLGKKLLNQVCNNYKQKYEKIIVKTNPEVLPFFIKQGFDKFIKQDENYLYYEKKL